MSAAAPAVAMVAAIALAIGGGALIRRGQADRLRGVLMLVMAAVLIVNVVIWTV